MNGEVRLESGFAEVDAGTWLMGCGQPAAFFGRAVRRPRRGWRVRDRSNLDLVETTGISKCASSSRPFLTHIPCAAPIFAVSDKVLVAPASARTGAEFVKAIPMSSRGSICVTVFSQPDGEPPALEPSDHQTIKPSDQLSAWVVMATAGRTARISLGEGDTVSVRPDAAVAWTGRLPTGFCPKLSIWDIILPRCPRDLLFTFYGPSILWIEGVENHQTIKPSNRQTFFWRRSHGV